MEAFLSLCSLTKGNNVCLKMVILLWTTEFSHRWWLRKSILCRRDKPKAIFCRLFSPFPNSPGLSLPLYQSQASLLITLVCFLLFRPNSWEPPSELWLLSLTTGPSSLHLHILAKCFKFYLCELCALPFHSHHSSSRHCSPTPLQ